MIIILRFLIRTVTVVTQFDKTLCLNAENIKNQGRLRKVVVCDIKIGS